MTILSKIEIDFQNKVIYVGQFVSMNEVVKKATEISMKEGRLSPFTKSIFYGKNGTGLKRNWKLLVL